MENFFTKRTLIWGGVLLIIIFGSLISFTFYNKKAPEALVIKNPNPQHTIIGKTIEGRPIETFTYGNGKTHLLFVGGIHGGYEWNSILLAYQFIDYLNANPEFVKPNMTITVIPSENPDGVYRITGKEGRLNISDIPANISTSPGRFNANNVDLNRNFDCNWQPKAVWQNKSVSGGSSPFSEPESQTLRDHILKDKPEAVVFWHSMSGSVYASQCNKGILPETLNIMNLYAKSSGYNSIKEFGSYPTTGDAGDWLASINIPAITVELKTHETVEWENNLAGIKALIDYYNNKDKSVII